MATNWLRIPETVLKLIYTRQLDERECTHLDQIQAAQPETYECAQCVARGDSWPNLRMCLICGYVGCCDTSKNKHMLAHIRETGHPIIRSIEPGEAWIWCYEDNAFVSAGSPQLANHDYPPST